MYEVKIYKDKVLKYGAKFDSKEELETWLEKAHYKKGRKEPEYVFEIKDLSKDYEWQLEQIRINRRKEYPSWEEVQEALIENMEGRPRKLEIVKKQREVVRNKYPKPFRESLKE